MATAIKKCRVCGKEYTACHTLRHTAGIFRWQEVACSPECGSIYLAEIRESRKKTEAHNPEIKETAPIEVYINEEADEEDLDKELAEYFDDNEDAAI